MHNIWRYREAIRVLAVRDFLARYVGTIGGPLWAIAHPLATVVIFWFVFSVGFKAQGPAGMPFVLYFVSGLIPWTLFSDVLNSSMNAVTANPHYVKKMVFPTEILPLVQLVSATFTHVILLLILFLIGWYYGYTPTLLSVQVIYYYVALSFLIVGFSWLLSALQVFHRDLGQGMILNLWFWLTPIVWVPDMIHEYKWVLQYNPMYYVIEGYRESLLSGVPLWSNLKEIVFFWAITGTVLLSGAYVFRRLKPEFADML
jgi:ABC-type polysaccharide/polyol phosphate export permease